MLLKRPCLPRNQSIKFNRHRYSLYCILNLKLTVKIGMYFGCCSVKSQMVNIPSFLVRVEQEKHIEFALTSPHIGGGGRPGRVKRKSMAAGGGGGGGDGDDE